MDFELQSFENLIHFHAEGLRSIQAGASAREVLSRSERRHLKRLDILILHRPELKYEIMPRALRVFDEHIR